MTRHPRTTGSLSQAPGLWRPAASRERAGRSVGQKSKGRTAKGSGRKAAHGSATRVEMTLIALDEKVKGEKGHFWLDTFVHAELDTGWS